MIANERQHRITRKRPRDFAHAIRVFGAGPNNRADLHPRLLQAEREAMESQLADLREELEEYERLKSSEVPVISVDSFKELADGLVRARIVGSLSQRALAQRLELKNNRSNGMKWSATRRRVFSDCARWRVRWRFGQK